LPQAGLEETRNHKERETLFFSAYFKEEARGKSLSQTNAPFLSASGGSSSSEPFQEREEVGIEMKGNSLT
jgi:hypothetical protein